MVVEIILYIMIIGVFGMLALTMIGIVVFSIFSFLRALLRGESIPIDFNEDSEYRGTYSATTNKDPIREFSQLTGYGNAIKGPTITEKDIRMAIKNLANKK